MPNFMECGVSCLCDGHCELEMQECQHESVEQALCGTCGGCGEGMHDGTCCSACNGLGMSADYYCTECDTCVSN